MLRFPYSPIPKVFHSFESECPFLHCFMCECDLMEEGRNYLIEKAYQGKEVLFEYAMCFDCREKLMQELSTQSRKLIDHYFSEHLDIENHRKSMMELHGKDTSGWLSHCLIKGTPISECKEHQIYAHCIDEDILFSGMPYALSGEAIDDIVQLLSDESLGVIGEFSKKLFGLDLPNPAMLI